MTNKEEIFDLLQEHPEGLDDDDITKITGIQSRQQVQQLCNQLANSKRIRRESIEKAGKRRKIHNFPLDQQPAVSAAGLADGGADLWRRRLSALVAATNRSEGELLDEALQLLAMKILKNALPSS
ncbi:MAG TPA: hypothetical protein VFR18_02355 [Terriglobia bacterium]|nr:hypothetical protein [Terriglobia bacterium]